MLSLIPYFPLLWLPFSTSYSYEPCNLCVDRASPSQLANISLRLFTNNNLDEYISVLVNSSTELLKEMNLSEPTVFYISGWTETLNSTSVQTVLGAYVERNDHNIILANYEEIASGDYIFVALSSTGVGYTLASALNDMVTAGFDSSSLHIVSHSMGCQVAGAVGSFANFTVPRITGLDPAGIGYYLIEDHLNADCAEFVDVIHTDAGGYGTSWGDATVDFYPNFGVRPQSGCELKIVFSGDDYCSHHRSWHYYTESLLNETALLSVKCGSNFNWALNWCIDNEEVIMGYGVATNASGMYFLQTNNESPYGRGIDGVKFDEKIYQESLVF